MIQIILTLSCALASILVLNHRREIAKDVHRAEHPLIGSTDWHVVATLRMKRFNWGMVSVAACTSTALGAYHTLATLGLLPLWLPK